MRIYINVLQYLDKLHYKCDEQQQPGLLETLKWTAVHQINYAIHNNNYLQIVESYLTLYSFRQSQTQTDRKTDIVWSGRQTDRQCRVVKRKVKQRTVAGIISTQRWPVTFYDNYELICTCIMNIFNIVEVFIIWMELYTCIFLL